MIYYIDFDNTLYNTPELIQRSLNEIGGDNAKEIFEKYITGTLDNQELVKRLDGVVLNGKDILYEDTMPFIKRLKENENNTLIMLTHSRHNLEYQQKKIIGSGISEYFNALYITTIPKYELDIDYTKGIFIDDNVSDLNGLYAKNTKKVIRIRREGNKHSVAETDNSNIPEYKDFNEVTI